MNIVIATRSAYPVGQSRHRQELRRRITLQSLRAQTDPGFTWLVQVGSQADAARLRQEAAGLQLDIRIGLQGPVPTLAQLRDAWDFSITTANTRMARLDDDDAVTADYVARLRAAGGHAPGTWYVFPNGYRVYKGHYTPFRNDTNQFIALDVPDGSGRRVYEINHSHVRQQPAVVEVDQSPAWLFVRHQESRSGGGEYVTAGQPVQTLPGFDIDRDFLATVR